jgi:broad specificity phosphatase PhoE
VNRLGKESNPAHLILVKHAMPDIDPAVPSREWRLSDDGRASCERLAEHLAPSSPVLVVSSAEPKAIQTGQLAALHLGIPFTIAEGLHENDRTGFPFLKSPRFEQRFAEYFANPDEVVIGQETAEAAFVRFSTAVARVERNAPAGTLVIVAHGTVISLLVGQLAGLDPFALWQQLGLPSYVVFDRESLKLVEVVETITA